MFVEAISIGAVAGLCIAVARRYPWYGALCLFVGLTLLGIFGIEYAYSATGKVGIFSVLVIAPFFAIPEARKAMKGQPVTAAAMKYVYGTYGALAVLALWGVGRTVEIFSK
ncbi:hypothetical protein [Humidesulfovibrio idahonensis]